MLQIIRIVVATSMALCFGFFGLACIWILWIQFRQGVASKSWPSTQGRVTSFRVRRDQEMCEDITYSYSLIYAYAVNGIGYKLKDLGDGVFTSSHAAEQAALTNHPVGQTAKVFYHPRKPQTAVLTPGLHLGCFLTFLIAFPMAIGCIVLAVNKSTEVLGWLMIGAPPETGCYGADLIAKQWTPKVCPPADAI